MAVRPVRVAAILLVAVVVLALVGDIAARSWAERVLAGRLRQELSLSKRPEVHLGGFPFLVSLARRRFPEATIETDGVRVRNLELLRCVLRLRDVRFSTAGGVVRAGSGDGEVELGDAEVSAYLQARGAPLAVAFLGPEVRVTTSVALGGAQAEAAATGRLRLRDGRLVFRPKRLEAAGSRLGRSFFAFEIPAPRVLQGIRYRSLRVGRGSAVLTAGLGPTIVRLAG